VAKAEADKLLSAGFIEEAQYTTCDEGLTPTKDGGTCLRD